MSAFLAKANASGAIGSARWQSVSIAPFDLDLELAVIHGKAVHAVVFPCRQIAGAWIDARTSTVLSVRPTHWRGWAEKGRARPS